MRNFIQFLFIVLFGFNCTYKSDSSNNENPEPDSLPIGHVVDNFKEVVDTAEPLPVWADEMYEEFIEEYHRLFQLEPTYLKSDFNGDGKIDVVIFVNRTNDNKRGLIYLFKDGQPKIIGAGKTLENAGDDFSWAGSWAVIEKGITHETMFSENGDVSGQIERILDHSAISIRQKEGSGGLIYWTGSTFEWIHQGD